MSQSKEKEVKRTKQRWPVEIIRSKNRRKTVSGELKGDTLIVRAPHTMGDKELQPIIENLQKRLARRVQKRNVPKSDDQLVKMARQLNKEYFDGRLHWQSIRFVTNQNKRFGSCTPTNATIRISHRLAKMPEWVLKYVVMHELAHLEEANHGPRFWRLVNQYPLTERARGYLMAVGLEDNGGEELS